MLFLVFFFALSCAQTEVGEVWARRYALTEAQNANIQFTANEDWFVYSTASSGRGTFLYSIPAQATSPSDRILLSHADIADGRGVRDFTISPDQSFVIFISRVSSTSSPNSQFTVPIGGGGITDITPKDMNPTELPTSVPYNFRPCACSGSQSNNFWALLDSAECNCNANTGVCSSQVSELWSNSRSGPARKFSVNLQQQQDETINKNVRRVGGWSDYIMYSANPGMNGFNDPSFLYLSDYASNNWRMTEMSASFWTNRTSPQANPSAVRSSDNSCTRNGRYIAFLDYVVSQDYQSVAVYDTQEKKLVGPSATVNPPLDAASSCRLIQFTPDSLKLIFQCNPAASSLPELYSYTLGSSDAATKITVSYTEATGTITTPTFRGDYMVWIQTSTSIAFRKKGGPSTSSRVLVSHNYKTGAASTVLFTEPTGETFTISLYASTSGTFNLLPGQLTGDNTAHVWFTVQNGNGTSPWVAAVAGGANSAVPVLTNVASTTIIKASNGQDNFCQNGGSSASCAVPSGQCGSCSCGSTSCSGVVLFIATLNGNTQPTLYTATFDGKDPTIHSPATFLDATPSYTGYHTDSDFKTTIFFTATTGTVGTSGTQLYRATAGTAGSTAISTTALVNLGSVLQPTFSPNYKYVAYRAETLSVGNQLETFLAAVDGSTAPVKISPATLDTFHTSTGTITFTTDNAFLVFFVSDSTAINPQNRMYSASVQATPTIVDLTMNLTAEVNSISSSIMSSFNAGTNFHCGQRGIVYQANVPTASSPAQLFGVQVTGGTSYSLTFNPLNGVSVGSWFINRRSFAVHFQAAFFTSTRDQFWNTASASAVASSFGVLALAVLALLF